VKGAGIGLFEICDVLNSGSIEGIGRAIINPNFHSGDGLLSGLWFLILAFRKRPFAVIGDRLLVDYQFVMINFRVVA
jgi:hypothetical protein